MNQHDLEARLAALEQQLKDSEARNKISASLSRLAPTAPDTVRELALHRLVAPVADQNLSADDQVRGFLNTAGIRDLVASSNAAASADKTPDERQIREQEKPIEKKERITLSEMMSEFADGAQIRIS